MPKAKAAAKAVSKSAPKAVAKAPQTQAGCDRRLSFDVLSCALPKDHVGRWARSLFSVGDVKSF